MRHYVLDQICDHVIPSQPSPKEAQTVQQGLYRQHQETKTMQYDQVHEELRLQMRRGLHFPR
jgi:hypothetical protein